jgi:sulfate/thiosulfate transport system ATP-binding protein
VTHDQEEALEVADEIVVINEGRVEQIGSPDELYDEPANDFVMGFLGEVTQLGRVTLRPHDIDVSRTPLLAGATEGTVTRVLRVGFEVRVTVRTTADADVTVVMTRTHARSLGIEPEVQVWLTPASGATVVPAMRALVG